MVPALEPWSHKDRKGNCFERYVETHPTRPIDPEPDPEPVRPTPVQPAIETPRATASSSASPVGEQASISKGLSIKGEITGTESLFIDGKVEGSINIPGNRVTVGKNGVVNASISAREIVVLGKLKGNVTATDRVDIRAEGALTGDVAAARISIEDGAFFKGGIDIRKADAKPPPFRTTKSQPTLRRDLLDRKDPCRGRGLGASLPLIEMCRRFNSLSKWV